MAEQVETGYTSSSSERDGFNQSGSDEYEGEDETSLQQDLALNLNDVVEKLNSDSEPPSEEDSPSSSARGSESKKCSSRFQNAHAERSGQTKKQKLGSCRGKRPLTSTPDSRRLRKKFKSASVPHKKTTSLQNSTGSFYKQLSQSSEKLQSSQSTSTETPSRKGVPQNSGTSENTSISQTLIPETGNENSVTAKDLSVSSVLGDISNMLGTVLKKLEKHESKLEFVEHRLERVLSSGSSGSSGSSDSGTKRKTIPQVVRVCIGWKECGGFVHLV